MKQQFSPTRDLWLEVHETDGAGRPLAGWVVNGWWWWKRSDELKAELACHSPQTTHAPVTTSPIGEDDWEDAKETYR